MINKALNTRCLPCGGVLLAEARAGSWTKSTRQTPTNPAPVRITAWTIISVKIAAAFKTPRWCRWDSRWKQLSGVSERAKRSGVSAHAGGVEYSRALREGGRVLIQLKCPAQGDSAEFSLLARGFLIMSEPCHRYSLMRGGEKGGEEF